MENIEIALRDNVSTKIDIYPGKGDQIIVMFPAMGVKGTYYKPLAEEFVKHDVTFISTDLRGNGKSSLRPSRKVNFGYAESINDDIKAIVDAILERYPSKEIYLAGHSLGGQLACLYTAKYRPSIKGVFLIACCSVFFKGYPGIESLKTLFGTQFLNIAGMLLGYMPGKQLGFGGLEAKGVIRDWSRQARTGKYIIDNDDFDYEKGMKELEAPIYALSFEGDKLAPKGGVEHLLGKFKEYKDYIYLEDKDPRNEGFNHFNWVKKPSRTVQIIQAWLREE